MRAPVTNTVFHLPHDVHYPSEPGFLVSFALVYAGIAVYCSADEQHESHDKHWSPQCAHRSCNQSARCRDHCGRSYRVVGFRQSDSLTCPERAMYFVESRCLYNSTRGHDEKERESALSFPSKSSFIILKRGKCQRSVSLLLVGT